MCEGIIAGLRVAGERMTANGADGREIPLQAQRSNGMVKKQMKNRNILQICNKFRKSFQDITIHQKLVQAHENNPDIIGIGGYVVSLYDDFLKRIPYFL